MSWKQVIPDEKPSQLKPALEHLCGVKIVSNPVVPEGTIYVSPEDYQRLLAEQDSHSNYLFEPQEQRDE